MSRMAAALLGLVLVMLGAVAWQYRAQIQQLLPQPVPETLAAPQAPAAPAAAVAAPPQPVPPRVAAAPTPRKRRLTARRRRLVQRQKTLDDFLRDAVAAPARQKTLDELLSDPIDPADEARVGDYPKGAAPAASSRRSVKGLLAREIALQGIDDANRSAAAYAESTPMESPVRTAGVTTYQRLLLDNGAGR